MNRWLKAELGTDALQMALNQCQPQAGLIMHTDRGSQYVADRYLQLRHYHGITPSMSRKGNCWDNAGAESFFHTLKTECVYLETFDTREQAQDVIFEYIEVFYNRQRRHSFNGNLAQWSMRRPKKQLNCLSGKVLTDHYRCWVSAKARAVAWKTLSLARTRDRAILRSSRDKPQERAHGRHHSH